MIFIETALFTKLIYDFLTDEEYSDLQKYLLKRPDAGKIITGSGGIRKLRWKIENRGKRGGVRIIYYWKKSEHEIWMITIYKKSKKTDIKLKTLMKIAEEMKNV